MKTLALPSLRIAALVAACVATGLTLAQTATEARETAGPAATQAVQATRVAQPAPNATDAAAPAAASTTAAPTTAPATTSAQPAAPSPASPGNLFQMLIGFTIVLAVLAGIAWALKRMGVAGPAVGSVAKIVGGVNVGNRERVLVVEVGDQWIVVGVAPGRVNALSTLPRQERTTQPVTTAPDLAGAKTFATWLKQTIDKRNGNPQ